MKTINGLNAYHGAIDGAFVYNTAANFAPIFGLGCTQFSYAFENFYHPYVGNLIAELNQTSVGGMLDPRFLSSLESAYTTPGDYTLDNSYNVSVNLENRQIDVSFGGPYANYNWELLYHIPVMVAVHLSNNQRFAEAQKWFHLVFDPTSTDTSAPPPTRFWRSFVFRQDGAVQSMDTLLQLLSTPDSQITDPAQRKAKANLITGYNAILADPFQPHAVARTRPSAYQWYVVMKYLDNLIAWGDSLFLADTIETINEATLCYVLAANILGPRPQVMPQAGTTSPKNFRQLKQAGLDRMSNALVNLEAQFPFNLAPPPAQNGNGSNDQSGALFGIGRALYFCIPQNQNLLAYWDTVADRLFKIRNSENIQGVVQQLPLFDPPIDPGMLIKAAAAGIDIGSIVSGLNQPLGPYRAPLLIQKALEIAGEVRSLGNALLASLEKGEAEQLALLRQGHEVQLQQLVQNVRYLQWQHAQETTNGLLKTRDSALERYTYYLRLLGLVPDGTTVPATFSLDRRELTEATFDAAYSALVTEYDQPVALQTYTQLQLAQQSPSNQSGATGSGQLYLNTNEDAELNTHLPAARDARDQASHDIVSASLEELIPSLDLDFQFWGLGLHSRVFGGDLLADITKIYAEKLQITAGYETDQAGIASRTASYQRRADEWMFQANLAARELIGIGRQIIASLIAEQVAKHDYDTLKAQVKQAQDVQAFLQTKFTSAVFYGWMQSQISGLYYQYYRFACDTARQAEQTMKRELMRPEVDATDFIQFNYWDSGYQGLLSGDALFLDIKRMEMAYYANNKRELELTRHVSLRQLDPLALLNLKITGSCTVTIPEWLYDRDCPGHYLRRIKSMALSIPSVVGPFTSLNCTATLQQSTVRVSSLLSNGNYKRDAANVDDRFVDYFSSVQSIVTSGGNADSGMFEPNLRDERFLPFEGAGAVGTWTLALPPELRAFNYMTISDVILHVRYTARDGGGLLGTQATKELKAAFSQAGQPGLMLLFSLRYDFPTEWSAFLNGSGGYTFALKREYFPYMVQSAKAVTIDGLVLYAPNGAQLAQATPVGVDLNKVTGELSNPGGSSVLTLPTDPAVLIRAPTTQEVFLVVRYHLGN